MPATKKINKQTNSTGATSHSGSSKPPIHADPFGPMLTADSNKKFVLCIMDALSKYAVVTAIANKEADMVADAIYSDWFPKFGILAQIHTDGGKEFVNKLSAELFQVLNTKTSPAHPQCTSGSI
jgi:hypothetical protein